MALDLVISSAVIVMEAVDETQEDLIKMKRKRYSKKDIKRILNV